MADENVESAQPAGEKKRGGKGWYVIPFLFTALIFGAAYGSIHLVNDGRFVYTIDDPYIHLALSENLAKFHYGINASEVSSPSSSILWPMMMALGAPFPIHEYLPLIIGILATFGSVALMLGIFNATGLSETPRGAAIAAGLACVAIVALNFTPLVFTGMEHPLQIFLSLAILLGLTKFLDHGRVPWWLVTAMILAPIIRYESLAISLAALLVLVLRRRFAAAGIAALVFIVIIGAFSAMLYSFGLPVLPSSILVHSEVARESIGSDGNTAAGIVQTVAGKVKTMLINVKDCIYNAEGRIVGALAVFMLVQFLLDFRHPRALLRLFGFVAIIVTLMGGKTGGSFFRYETNIVIVAIFAFVCANGDWFRAMGRHATARYVVPLAAVLFVVLFSRYVTEAAKIPGGANNIYEQQYQLHRFAVDYYQAPIAVNDLGWMSYKNPNYVLDLWGLASDEARRARAENRENWMDELTDKHETDLAILFEEWFEEWLPESWDRVAVLKLSGPRITTAKPEVVFFATEPGARPDIVTKLKEFQPTLPEGVKLEFVESEPADTTENDVDTESAPSEDAEEEAETAPDEGEDSVQPSEEAETESEAPIEDVTAPEMENDAPAPQNPADTTEEPSVEIPEPEEAMEEGAQATEEPKVPSVPEAETPAELNPVPSEPADTVEDETTAEAKDNSTFTFRRFVRVEDESTSEAKDNKEVVSGNP